MKLWPREWVAVALFALSFVLTRVYTSSGPGSLARWAMVAPMFAGFVLMLPTMLGARRRR